MLRGEYGWVEYVEPGACESPAAVGRFYWRLGALLAILHNLAACDCHRENLVAAGEDPVLVDAESLFSPEIAPPSDFADGQAEQLLFQNRVFNASVQRVGLLPTLTFENDDHEGIDLSGMGGDPGQQAPFRLWTPHLDSNGVLSMKFVETATSSSTNRPNLSGRPVPPYEQIDSLVAGFKAACEIFLDHRDDICSPTGPIAAFRGARIRILLRPTAQYAMVLQSATHPSCSTDGVKLDFRFDRLLTLSHWSNPADVIAAERRDLWHFDIPLFTSEVGSRDLHTSNGDRIHGFFLQDGLSLVNDRIMALTRRHISSLTWAVEMAVRLAEARSTSAAGPAVLLKPADEAYRKGTRGRSEPSEHVALSIAQEIGDALNGHRLDVDGFSTWLGISPNEKRLGQIGFGLYDGASGIALFLAYLGAVLSDESYSNLARAAIRTARWSVAWNKESLGIGAFTGICGYIYVLTHCAALWGDTQLLAEAANLVSVVDERVAKDDAYDITGGSAGAILVLLRLHSRAPFAGALRVAERCGEHLIEASLPQRSGSAWASSFADRPLTGLGHGAGGIALALIELSNATGRAEFASTAIQAIAYERDVFDARRGEWPDFRTSSVSRPSQTRNLQAWCQGAAGIGLARCRIARLWTDDLLFDEIEHALRLTAGAFGDNDSLCHGDLGMREFLVEADLLTHDPATTSQLESITARILRRINQTGYRTGVGYYLDTPDLMRGMAGIGFGLLRISDHDAVPSVLLLDAPVAPAP